jgi:PAS domain S-box-containing protein
VVVSIAAAALALSAAALAVGMAAPFAGNRVLVAVTHALLIAAPVGVGIYALERQPDSRFARLLIAAGFLWAPSLLAASSNSTLYSIGRVDGWIVSLSVIALVLAFPSGRLDDGVPRKLVLLAAVLVGTLYLPTALLLDHYPDPSPWSACVRDCPPNGLAVAHPEPRVVSALIEPMREVLAIGLFVAAAGVLALRISRASRLMRQTLAPVLAAAIVTMVAQAAFLVARRVNQWSGGTEIVGFVSLLAIPGLVVAFLLGLLRWRLRATAALRRLTEEFGRTRSRSGVRAVLARAIGDPSLQIAYWTEQPGRWIDESGIPVTLPREDPARAVTEVAAHGEIIAALIHDAALVPEPAMREVAGGFALMALENQRLDAELHASLRELRRSRARILSAVDLERQRIERDLHDGAQQRLVALRVGLEVAAEAVQHDPKDAAQLLDKLGHDVEATLDEIRSLARGVYPPLLADHGIGEALRIAARAGSLPTTVRSRGLGRHPQQIEAAVYFCCLEALQNATKHAGAHSATITLSDDEQELRFEVRDDGSGLQDPNVRGVGLDNMRDRIVSLGGRLTIESAPREGTRVIGTVPVGFAYLTPDVENLLLRATDALDDCFGIYRAVRDSNGSVVDFRIEHLNDAACRAIGRSREIQLGRTLGQLEPGYLESEKFAWHRQALDTEGPSTLEDVKYETSESGRRLAKAYEVRAAPLGGGRLAVTWREITKRKRKENALLLQWAALARAAEGVCLVRASDGVIVYANPRLAEIYGYEPGELDGRHVAELNWEDELGGAERRTREILADLDERGEGSYELLSRRKDGSSLWSEARITSFDHPDHGKVWVSVQQDVTARHEPEEALRGARHPTESKAASSR